MGFTAVLVLQESSRFADKASDASKTWIDPTVSGSASTGVRGFSSPLYNNALPLLVTERQCEERASAGERESKVQRAIGGILVRLSFWEALPLLAPLI